MRKFLVLVKKEIRELLTLQAILPLVVMVVLFGFIGNIISSEQEKLAQPQPLWVVDQDKSNFSPDVVKILESANFVVTYIDDRQLEDVLQEAQEEKEISSVLVIPKGFSKGVLGQDPQKLEVYNLFRNLSVTAMAKYAFVDRAVGVVSTGVSDKWIQEYSLPLGGNELRNPITRDEFVTVNGKTTHVSMSAVIQFVNQQVFFVPVILLFIIIIATQMVATAVATEKENKTLETLLSAPVGRKTIVFSKLAGAGFVALVFAGVYMIGFKSYMSGMMGGAAGGGASDALTEALVSLGLVISPYGYILLGLSLFLGILVALAIAVILGILIEDTKSLPAVIAPLMIVIMIPYLLVIFLDPNTISPILRYAIYLIPFSHPFLAIQKVLTQEFMFVTFGILYQIFVFIVFVIIASKIFSSDKVLTLKWRGFKRRKKTPVSSS